MQLNQHLREEVGNSFGSMDDQEEDRKPSKTLSVLQRLDRLDQLVRYTSWVVSLLESPASL